MFGVAKRNESILVGTGLLGIDEAVVAETVPNQQNETRNLKKTLHVMIH